MIGNGKRYSYVGALQVTGNCAIPDNFKNFNVVEFASLVFNDLGGEAFDFDQNTGEITFKADGNADIKGILNIDTSTGISEVQICPKYHDGNSWTYRNARKAELPVIGASQTVSVGVLPDVRIGHKLMFAIKSPDGNGDFLTEILGNGSIVPSVILQIMINRR